MSVIQAARRLAPGLDWISGVDDGVGGDGATFAAAAVSIPGDRAAGVNLALIGGCWYGELVIVRDNPSRGASVRVQSQALDPDEAWRSLLRLCSDVGGLDGALVLYNAQVNVHAPV